MKPGSDTRQKVFVAADQLLEQGKRPTQQNVRELIGSGSLTTINKALGDWWTSLGERITRRNQHPEVPEVVLLSAGKLWDQALGYAEQRFVEQRTELERQHRENLERARQDDLAVTTDLRQLQEQNARLLERNEQLSMQLETSQSERLRQEERLIRLVSDNEEQARQLKQQTLLLERGAGDADTEQLLDLRVRLRIQEEDGKRLHSSNEALAQENAGLRRQLREQERSLTDRIHQLELELARREGNKVPHD
ncbi:DNA-binding protein [Marinobacterium rhizophilum]|uniref:DNA-binding protein n=1 Tax=Marinobacterium rhizophilum TaxID=420402 RepID=A0ABY5HN15_9GAMM|nr:DNA-binding protein [Marinobacterium rhizophilum]UTW12978.1 DNA-binding protein [Marinobacterium rhizophilum]